VHFSERRLFNGDAENEIKKKYGRSLDHPFISCEVIIIFYIRVVDPD
jgi:hypothetical protein